MSMTPLSIYSYLRKDRNKRVSTFLFSIRKHVIHISQDVLVLIIGSVGGFLCSLTGLSVGWMIGTMLILGYFSLQCPSLIRRIQSQRGILPHWKQAGQIILAIQVGQQMTFSVVHVFQSSWFLISIMLLLSLSFSLLLGFLLWRFSGTNLLTSLYASTPGGISNMPSVAQEVGANPVTVSLIQTMRIFLVVSIIPLFATEWKDGSAVSTTILDTAGSISPSVLWTGILTCAAMVGYSIGKWIGLPAPRLVGGIIGVAVIEFAGSTLLGTSPHPWLPSWVKILAQIFLGASIGLSVKRQMFVGMGKVALMGLVSSFSLVVLMLGCSAIVSHLIGIPFLTSILAFAPGGVAEMAVTAISLKADTSFVVAVQTLRLITIFLVLPPIFNVLHKKLDHS
jgi:uncharacterized protein